MAVSGKGGVGIPTLLFHEGEGLTLSIETKDGALYRGRAEFTEDNMNVSLVEVTAYGPPGSPGPAGGTRLERAFIRGSQITFVVYPPILAKAPFFERVRAAAAGKVRAIGLGRARMAAIQQAQGEWRGRAGRRAPAPAAHGSRHALPPRHLPPQSSATRAALAALPP
jgi:small nuclear ribonucleoprotein D3